MAVLEEKVLERATLFEGVVFDVTRDRVALPDGSEGIRDVLRHKGAVCVLPLTEQGEVLLVRQFRHGFGGVTLEIPAGKLESSDTDPKSAVLRELKEETGAVPGRLLDLGVFYGSPAIVDEKIYMYLATDLTFGATSPDADEFIEIERVPLPTAVEWVLAGTIPDGKTQAAALRAYLMAERGEI
jgi:ADP-ribose pyrophosphatase